MVSVLVIIVGGLMSRDCCRWNDVLFALPVSAGTAAVLDDCCNLTILAVDASCGPAFPARALVVGSTVCCCKASRGCWRYA